MKYLKGVSIALLSCTLALAGCSKGSNAKTIPENSYTDEKKCHVKSKDDTSEPVLHFLLAEYNESKVFSKEYINQEINNAISRGCDVNEAGYKGYKPLYLAVLYNADDQIKNLIEHGADPSQKVNGRNLFEFSEAINKKKPSAEQEKTNALVQSYKK